MFYFRITRGSSSLCKVPLEIAGNINARLEQYGHSEPRLDRNIQPRVTHPNPFYPGVSKKQIVLSLLFDLALCRWMSAAVKFGCGMEGVTGAGGSDALALGSAWCCSAHRASQGLGLRSAPGVLMAAPLSVLPCSMAPA